MRDMTDRVIVGDPVKKMKDNTYSSMFNYFNNRYGGDTDSTNYIHVIKSMKKESKISDLVKTYNRVLKKLLLLTYGKEEFISDLWVEYEL